jgi:predicted dehydrogenase
MRAVIVGVAHWHAPIYAKALAEASVTLAGASDLDPIAGEAAAAQLGLAFDSDAAAMLDRLRPDIAFVLPRHDRAMDEARPVLARRIPFLIEKPMGRTGAQAREVADAARASGVFAAAALANRELAIWTRLAELRAAGRLGTVMHAHFRVVNGPPGRYRDWGVGWMLDPAISGGGALRNLGFHGVDAALALASGRTLHVRGAAVGHAAYRLPVEEFATALLQVEGGPAITVEAGYSYAAAGGDMEWRIAATGAYLKQTSGRLEIRHADGALEATDMPPPGYLALVQETLRRLRAGLPPSASLDDCAAAADLIDRIYDTASRGDLP